MLVQGTEGVEAGSPRQSDPSTDLTERRR